MESKRIDLKKMREHITKRKASTEIKRRLFIENLSREKFCKMLEGLPPMFRFELRNIREDFDGYWEKTIQDGKTAWQRGNKNLLSQFLFPFKKEVCDAIDREIGVYYKTKNGWQAKRKILLNDGTVQILTRKKGEIALSLNKETLKTLYFKHNKSLEEIAREYGCTRQNIMKIMKQYGLERRSKSEARIEAIKKGKFEGFEYHEIDERFFSQWSPEMAWVLGLLFTDGTITNTRVAIHSVDIDLLEKIRNLLKSTNPIRKRIQSYDKSKHIYEFAFFHKKMRDDLLRLGLQERKSLIMVFPDIPEKYMRHFIRGCWDGDGSVFLDKGRIVASYISGSKKFIERLVQELYGIRISKSGLSYRFEKEGRKVLKPVTKEILSNYPNGRLPLTIHMKNINAYYIKIQTRENVEKLFHYFYDGIDESMYLSRKYNVFAKGLKLEGKEKREQLTLDLEF